jgi:hypothetical protein
MTILSTKALWEIPGLGVDVGLFWWFHHKIPPQTLSNTEIPKDPPLILLQESGFNQANRSHTVVNYP